MDDLKKYQQALVKLIEGHDGFLKQRERHQNIGLALLGLAIGNIIGSLIVLLYFHKHVNAFWFGASIGGSITAILISACTLRHNNKFVRSYRTARDSMTGLLQTRQGTALRALHLDQAEAAINELERLLKVKIKRQSPTTKT